MSLADISRPTLLIREKVCRANIARMQKKAAEGKMLFRPHFKTHQLLEVGRWFREAGIEAITVSSASMALKFAADGWSDITIAFPANIREAGLFNRLAATIRLNLLLDSPVTAAALGRLMKHPTGIFIEIDCGQERSGLSYADKAGIDETLAVIRNSPLLSFRGFLTHAGQTYAAGSREEIIRIHRQTSARLQQLKERYRAGFPEMHISIGDTPSCSILPLVEGADEIRPGNFVYYDLMQHYLGSCSLDDIAVAVACPVCGIYPQRNEVLIYGGAVHLSREYLNRDGVFYGLPVLLRDDGWAEPLSGSRLVSLSQEHGLIRTSPGQAAGIRHGGLIGILPVHACLSAALLQDEYMIMR
jgi:D-serine deaminase-like pyridoxal phosphate-dependent protein